MAIRLHVATLGRFEVEHSSDCAVPGYVIISPSQSAATLSDLSPDALTQLGTVLLGVYSSMNSRKKPHHRGLVAVPIASDLHAVGPGPSCTDRVSETDPIRSLLSLQACCGGVR